MMLEKGKISAFQMGLLMYPAVLASGFLVLPTITGQYAQNDLWLTCLPAALIGLIAVYTVTRLHELFPGQTVVQYSGRILGKIPGKIIGLVYITYNLHASGGVTRQYAEFVTGNFLFKTPLMIVMGSLILLSAIAVRGGVEMLARSTVIFLPLFILPVFFLLLLIPDLDAKTIFPILSHGITPVMKGSFIMMGWLNELFLMTFFLPSLTDPEKGRKWGYISVAMIVLFLTYSNLIALFLLGPDLRNKVYPLLVAFRYIGVGTFLENLESLLLAMWVIGNFLQVGVFLYAASLSLAQCFELSDYQPIVFPLALLSLAIGIWDVPNFPVFGEMVRMAVPFHILTTNLVIPLILLAVASLRKRKTAGE
ncbi:MAG: endospore germination permease [Paenibacillus macerans]|nr:endospore germination permease [Paenibacillus macerans]MCY7558729.1 spore germination protein [Paenibacillus macerans]MDU5947926.1 endospore germination permease [Paenibacillus macerans]MDU7475999.1 endospore germination permease [Paenibacillus macerans]MEC0140561.1 endospore germination permease [Paenibacillus macerans]MEC0153067.1 endospore germination permease [Paenibacillus macerans]